MNHIRQNGFKPRGYCQLQDKEWQIVTLLGSAFHATVHNVISKHCGRLEGRISINGKYQKVRQVSRGYWEAI